MLDPGVVEASGLEQELDGVGSTLTSTRTEGYDSRTESNGHLALCHRCDLLNEPGVVPDHIPKPTSQGAALFGVIGVNSTGNLVWAPTEDYMLGDGLVVAILDARRAAFVGYCRQEGHCQIIA